MKRVLAISFLFVFLIAYITPITSVYATEVNWGDNNTYTWTDEQYNMFKKIAVLSLIPDLLSTGINELSINNANNIDDFIDNLLDFIDNNPDSIINTNTWSTLNDLNKAIQDKTEEIGNKLIYNGLVVTGFDGSLHSVFEPQYNNTIPKIEYKPNSDLIPIFNRLSRLNSGNPTPFPTPNVPNDYSFINNINKLYLKYSGNYYQFFPNSNLDSYIYDNGYRACDLNIYGTLYCSSADFSTMHVSGGNKSSVTFQTFSPIITVYLTTLDNNTVNANWSTSQLSNVFNNELFNRTSVTITDYLNNHILRYTPSNYNDVPTQPNSFSSLNIALNWIYSRYSNINIYVNNELWVYAGSDTPTNINIDVNGIEFYGGTNEPIRYYYPNGTQIDFQKLYEVIKRAINNNTPITNETIWEGDTYYDSHDNVYSPNIFNYYSNDDNETESDVLEDIINLAIIPKFDTALLEPIEEPLVNGEKIMILGVQSLPEDILFVIGAGFVLILFSAMINRLIE